VRFYDDSGHPTDPVCNIVTYLNKQFFESLAQKKKLSEQKIEEKKTKKPVAIVKTIKEVQKPIIPKIEVSSSIKKISFDTTSPLNKNIALTSLIDSINYGDYSDEVKSLQKMLRSYGFFPADFEITGYYGDETLTGVNKYKKFIELNSKFQSVANI
jgi:hypothetical protein